MVEPHLSRGHGERGEAGGVGGAALLRAMEVIDVVVCQEEVLAAAEHHEAADRLELLLALQLHVVCDAVAMRFPAAVAWDADVSYQQKTPRAGRRGMRLPMGAMMAPTECTQMAGRAGRSLHGSEGLSRAGLCEARVRGAAHGVRSPSARGSRRPSGCPCAPRRRSSRTRRSRRRSPAGTVKCAVKWVRHGAGPREHEARSVWHGACTKAGLMLVVAREPRALYGKVDASRRGPA